MVFRPGPVFTHLLLADEINRASPKTQSALLEAMQERCVTLLGTTRELPDPFFVLASQNPIELEGTYPLPEAQLDRFLFKLVVQPADADTLDRIISTRRHGTPPAPNWRIDADELRAAVPRHGPHLPAAAGVALHRPAGGRDAPQGRPRRRGRSRPTSRTAPRRAPPSPWPRRPAPSPCWPAGRPSASRTCRRSPPPVLNHRLILNYKARLDQVDAFALVADLLDRARRHRPGPARRRPLAGEPR